MVRPTKPAPRPTPAAVQDPDACAPLPGELGGSEGEAVWRGGRLGEQTLSGEEQEGVRHGRRWGARLVKGRLGPSLLLPVRAGPRGRWERHDVPGAARSRRRLNVCVSQMENVLRRGSGWPRRPPPAARAEREAGAHSSQSGKAAGAGGAVRPTGPGSAASFAVCLLRNVPVQKMFLPKSPRARDHANHARPGWRVHPDAPGEAPAQAQVTEWSVPCPPRCPAVLETRPR